MIFSQIILDYLITLHLLKILILNLLNMILLYFVKNNNLFNVS